ncbi:hypothetical protein SLEP1_g11916 [Rubroshorea leprosula]|nr:hypothetical protein SLEP1_g11916 [Rubroshorea leprosula]
MAQHNLFYAVFIFLTLMFILEIQFVEGRHLKFHSEKLNTYKRFLAKETTKVDINFDIKATDTDVQSPPAAPLTPGAVAGASQGPPPRHVDDFRPTMPGHSPGIGHATQN